MLRGLKTFLLRLLAGANIATVALMLLVGNADYIPPVSHPILANAGLLFPVLLLANLLFLFLWLMVYWKGVVIPFAGYLLCFPSVRIYMPLNAPREPDADAIKVISYNVCRFGMNDPASDADNPIISYIHDSSADIVCLQEASSDLISQKKIHSRLEDVYQYCDTAARHYSGNTLAIYSKYPIVGKEHIAYDSKWNLSAAFKVVVDGDTVVVVNNHLETNQLLRTEQERFKELVRGHGDKATRQETSRMLIERLAEAVSLRQPEALAVVDYVRRHQGMPLLLCGDLNDHPLSYARRVIASELTDCFVSQGRGFGWSYNKSGMLVRIDHFFCSSHWEPYRCEIDRKIKVSDHYPLVCWLKKRTKS